MSTIKPVNSSQDIINKISRFGIQNSADLVIFLESPKGLEVQAEILEQLAIAEAFEAQITAETRLEQRRHDLMVVLLLLGLMYEEDAKAKDIINNIIQDSEKLLAAHKAPTTPTTERNEQQIYENMAEKLQQQLLAHTEEEVTINQEIEKVSAKYDVYDSHIEAIEGKFEAHTVDDLDKEIKTRAGELEKQFIAIQDSLDDALKSGDDAKVADIQKQLNDLNGKQIEIEAIKDIHALKTGTKEIYTENGQPLYYHDAKKQLIKKNGEYFLLDKGESLEGNEQKGRSSFKNAEPSLLNVKSLLDRNKGLEIAAFAERQQKLDLKGELLQKSLLELDALKPPKISPTLSKAACTTTPAPSPKPKAPTAIIPPPEDNQLKALFERLSSSNVTRQDASELLAFVKDNPGIHNNANLCKTLENMMDRTPDSTTLKTSVKDRLCFLQILHNAPAQLAVTNSEPKLTNWPPKPKNL